VLLRRFQQAGHRPIALVGGATGMVGDPSGKSEERNLLSKETLAKNVAGLQQQMRRFLDFEGAQAASLVNNFDWMKDFSFLDFLRDVGKNVPVNVMLTKDSVKQRLERQDGGLSFTEFSYMLLQAYDFAYLAKEHTCRLQIGGRMVGKWAKRNGARSGWIATKPALMRFISISSMLPTTTFPAASVSLRI
jgi:tyrosyl-tRNA synthetase